MYNALRGLVHCPDYNGIETHEMSAARSVLESIEATKAPGGTILSRHDNGRPATMACHCGQILETNGPGQDVCCELCGAEFNSAGQSLAPRSQWGEETSETAADFDRGNANPDRAFDED
ncbi:MAG: hypothetical protein WC130_12670 [Kiritimatiellia bacterium]